MTDLCPRCLGDGKVLRLVIDPATSYAVEALVPCECRTRPTIYERALGAMTERYRLVLAANAALSEWRERLAMLVLIVPWAVLAVM